jgi:hypothetical protein
VPFIVGWMVQCQPTVCVRLSEIVWVFPAGNGVFELPSSSVNVCSVVSLFVTVSVTLPELTSTELGSNAKLAAVIVAVLPPPPPAGLVAVLEVLELLLLEHAAAVSINATARSPAMRSPFISSPSPAHPPPRARITQVEGVYG